MLPNSIFYHITDSYYIVECVQKDEVRFVVPVAFLRARLKHFLHINILYSMLLKQIFVMDTTEKLVFSPPIKFLDHSRRGGSYHAGSSGAYKETAAVVTQNGAAQGSLQGIKPVIGQSK